MDEAAAPAACSGCGLVLAGGTDGCRALWQEHGLRGYNELERARFHRHVTDIYCLQHPDPYCVSAKSLAAHLAGLCWILAYDGDAAGYAALNRWLDGPSPLRKPAIPAFRGALTIAEVVDVTDDAAYVQAVDRWARTTWDAYAALRPLARQWVEAALATPHRSRWR